MCVLLSVFLCELGAPLFAEQTRRRMILVLYKMASRCERINPDVKPAPQELQDKHYYRKHGANAYYGQ